MANTFKRYTSNNFGTTVATVYTVPAATTSVTIGMVASNKTAAEITVSVTVAGSQLVKDIAIPAGSSLSLLDGKIVLEATDTVTVISNTATAGDFILSVMEIA